MNVKIYPSEVLSFLNAPPSYDASHKAVVIAAMCRGVTKIEDIDLCDDVMITLGAVKTLGAGVMFMGGGVLISGIDMNREYSHEHIIIDVRDSYATLSLVLPLASFLFERVTFKVKNPRIFNLRAYEDIYRQRGYYFEITDDAVNVSGRLGGGEYKSVFPITFPFFDGLMLLAPHFRSRTDIYYLPEYSSASHMMHTVDYMELFRVRCLVSGDCVQVAGGGKYFTDGRIKPEKDYLKASQFMVFGMIRNGIFVTGFEGDKVVSPEVSILDILGKCDGTVREENGGLTVSATHIPPFTIDLTHYSELIPIISVMAAFSEGYCVIKGCDSVKYAESDRISHQIYELRKSDVNIGIGENGELVIKGGKIYFGSNFDCHDDPVLAAALAIFAALCVTESEITGTEIINRWYPGFMEDMRDVGITVVNG